MCAYERTYVLERMFCGHVRMYVCTCLSSSARGLSPAVMPPPSVMQRVHPVASSSSGDVVLSERVVDGHLKRLFDAVDSLKIPDSLDSLRRARPKNTVLQAVLRKGLRQNLDIQVVPVWRGEDGRQVAMSDEEMATIYSREQQRMVAYKARLQEAVVALTKWRLAPPVGNLDDAGLPLSTPRVAFAFWHGRGDNHTLPQHVIDGLTSCVLNSGLKTILLTYGEIAGVPEGVQVSPASAFLASRAFHVLLDSGVRVQHLSDYVRALALHRAGGWFVDGDTVWFRKAPYLSAAVPPCLGHYFASLQAHRKTPQGYTVEGKRLHWNANYLKEPGDFAFIASPCAFSARSEVLRRWVCKMEAALFGTRLPTAMMHPMQYESFFRFLQEVVREEGMIAAIRDTTDASPIPATMGSNACLASKSHLFDLAALPHALCANNYAQTSKFDAAACVVEAGSAWHAVLQASRSAEACPSTRMVRKASWQEQVAVACNLKVPKVSCPDDVDDEQAAAPAAASNPDADDADLCVDERAEVEPAAAAGNLSGRQVSDLERIA